jgi:hypothetical protein
LGRLGGPCRRFRRRSKTRSESISCELGAGESERPVVARKPRLSRGGAKGPWRGRADSEGEGADWRNPMTARMPSPKSEAAVGSQIISMMKAPTQVPCESRMREIRTSGLRRGRARRGHWLTPFIPCVPLYSTSKSGCFRNGINSERICELLSPASGRGPRKVSGLQALLIIDDRLRCSFVRFLSVYAISRPLSALCGSAMKIGFPLPTPQASDTVEMF